jgi:hypothetical protein
MKARSLLVLVTIAAALAWPARAIEAQSPRPGIRLTLTRVEAMGGFTASGFLVVPGSRIVRTEAPECGEGAVRIDATGRDARGRIRGAHLVVIAAPIARDVSFGAGPCDATLAVELDDGSTLSPDRGSIHVQLTPPRGLDATVAASAAGPTGVPTTVAGHVLLPSG